MMSRCFSFLWEWAVYWQIYRGILPLSPVSYTHLLIENLYLTDYNSHRCFYIECDVFAAMYECESCPGTVQELSLIHICPPGMGLHDVPCTSSPGDYSFYHRGLFPFKCSHGEMHLYFGRGTVSYTHLDVYKRQSYHRSRKSGAPFLSGA